MAFLDTAHIRSATLRDAFRHVLRAWRTRREQRLARLAFQRLATYDAHLLDDMGLTHADLAWGSSLPIDMDAAAAVRRRARNRRTQERRRR